MEFLKFIIIYNTIIHLASRTGNIDLVKYIISLNKIDITSKNIFFTQFFF